MSKSSGGGGDPSGAIAFLIVIAVLCTILFWLTVFLSASVAFYVLGSMVTYVLLRILTSLTGLKFSDSEGIVLLGSGVLWGVFMWFFMPPTWVEGLVIYGGYSLSKAKALFTAFGSFMGLSFGVVIMLIEGWLGGRSNHQVSDPALFDPAEALDDSGLYTLPEDYDPEEDDWSVLETGEILGEDVD